jgi:hypothetical protein
VFTKELIQMCEVKRERVKGRWREGDRRTGTSSGAWENYNKKIKLFCFYVFCDKTVGVWR